jgi:S1-C subfamily serine protease
LGGTAFVISLLPKRATVETAKNSERDQGINVPQQQSVAQGEDSSQSKPAKVNLSAEELYARASPAVVTIKVKNDDDQSIGSGSGFFVKNELVHDANSGFTEFAYLLTNYHVVETAVNAEIALSDGSKSEVFEVVTEDEAADLALLSILLYSSDGREKKPPMKLPLAHSKPQVGAKVYAIGSPQGLANSLSEGIISGIREIKPPTPWLQTTAPISPGSSGGPLLTPEGEVVGVTTAIRRDAQNLNFAIPVSELRRFLSAPYRKRDLWEGRSYREQESHEFRALEFRSYAKGVPDDDPALLLLKARRQIGKKDYDDAIHTLSVALDSVPPEVRFLGQFLLAKAHYWLANKQVGLGGGRIYQNNEHAEAALQWLKEAARLNSKFAPTFALLADYHFRAGEWPEGLVVADSLVKLMPQCAGAYLKRGRFFRVLNRAKSALEDFQVALKLDPRDPEVHVQIGDAWFDLHEYQKSVDSYTTSLSMKDSSAAYCHFRIGCAYQEAGKYQQAIVAYEKARSLGMDAESCERGISICQERMK